MCVFVCEIRQNDNGTQIMSGLNSYLVQFFQVQGLLLPTGLCPCLFCDGIFAVLATIVSRYVNPTPEQELTNLRLGNFGQQKRHVHSKHKKLFGVFSIPRRHMVYRKEVHIQRLIVRCTYHFCAKLLLLSAVCSGITVVIFRMLRHR